MCSSAEDLHTLIFKTSFRTLVPLELSMCYLRSVLDLASWQDTTIIMCSCLRFLLYNCIYYFVFACIQVVFLIDGYLCFWIFISYVACCAFSILRANVYISFDCLGNVCIRRCCRSHYSYLSIVHSALVFLAIC